MVKCIHCQSEDINYSVENKGFSGGKALAGAIIAGPLGLLAGTIGSKNKNTVCLCNSCHKTFLLSDFEKAEVTKKNRLEFDNLSPFQKFLRVFVLSLLFSFLIAIPLSWTDLTYENSYYISVFVINLISAIAIIKDMNKS